MKFIEKSTSRTLFSVIALFTALISPVIIATDSKETKSSFTYQSYGAIDIHLGYWIPETYPLNLVSFDGRCMTFNLSKGYNDKATNHTIQLSKSSNMSSPISGVVYTTATTTTAEYEFKGLSGNTTYYYRARNNNGLKADWSSVKSFKTVEALKTGDMFTCM